MPQARQPLPRGIFLPHESLGHSPTGIKNQKQDRDWGFILGSAEMECLAGLILDLGLHFLQWVGADLLRLAHLKRQITDLKHQATIQFLTTRPFDVLDIARDLSKRGLVTIQEAEETFLVFPTEELVHAAFLSSR